MKIAKLLIAYQNFSMIKKIQKKIQKNSEIFALSLLMIITVISTTYYNYDKKKFILIIKT